MDSTTDFSLAQDAIRLPFTVDVADYCEPFHCDDPDLDDFFLNDAIVFDSELLGKTYAWVDGDNPSQILGMVTLANDSVKAKYITSTAKNRIQRGINNAKRGINYPAVLIGRLGVSAKYRGKGLNIGSQILDFIKDWFRSSENKTGCRFIVVDAYNNDRTLHFYEKNGFKLLYLNEQDEREFHGLNENEMLKTRFLFFDLKKK